MASNKNAVAAMAPTAPRASLAALLRVSKRFQVYSTPGIPGSSENSRPGYRYVRIQRELPAVRCVRLMRRYIPGIFRGLRRLAGQRNHALAVGLAIRDLLGLLR